MYLFSRTARIRQGHLAEAMNVSARSVQRISEVSGNEFETWAKVLGAGVGTVGWTTVFESLAQWSEAVDLLTADPTWLTLQNEIGQHFEPADDAMGQIVYGSLDGNAEPPSVVHLNQSALAAGHYTSGIAAAVEIAETAEQITGGPTWVVMPISEQYSSINWVTPAGSASEMDDKLAKLAAEPSWGALVDRVGPLYQPTTAVSIWRRVA
jgi:hypothetical protein